MLGAVGKRYGTLGILGRCTGNYLAAPGIESLKRIIIQTDQNVFEAGAGNF